MPSVNRLLVSVNVTFGISCLNKGYDFNHFLIVAGLPICPGVHSNSRPLGWDRGWFLVDGLGAVLCHYCHADKSCGAWQGKESHLNEGPSCHRTLPVKLCSHLTITQYLHDICMITWPLMMLALFTDLTWLHMAYDVYIHSAVIL